MIFLFPRWDMLIPWRELLEWLTSPENQRLDTQNDGNNDGIDGIEHV